MMPWAGSGEGSWWPVAGCHCQTKTFKMDCHPATTSGVFCCCCVTGKALSAQWPGESGEQ